MTGMVVNMKKKQRLIVQIVAVLIVIAMVLGFIVSAFG